MTLCISESRVDVVFRIEKNFAVCLPHPVVFSPFPLIGRNEGRLNLYIFYVRVNKRVGLFKVDKTSMNI